MFSATHQQKATHKLHQTEAKEKQTDIQKPKQ